MDAAVSDQAAPSNRPVDLLKQSWPLLIGLALIIGPSFVRLAQDIWSTDAGVHGPIVLATGGWLLARAWPNLRNDVKLGPPVIGWAGLVTALLLYIIGRALSFISLEIAGAMGVLIAVGWLYLGPTVLRKLWFPILYIGFLIPLPGWVLDVVTAPLKQFISVSATHILSFAGYPIAREGVTIYIAQYQLLVEDACSGLNSIISLTAIGLFYIYLLHNASWRYSLFLVFWILPAAIFANLVRVIMLVLVTYYLGNETAQGVFHPIAGLIMFVIALLFIFAVDKAMEPIRRRLAGSVAV